MSTTPDPARQDAIDRLKAKQAFWASLGAYVIINAFLWILWAMTDDEKDGIPWPLWVTVGWGVGMAFYAFNIFGRRPMSEEAIQREMRRGGAN